MLSKESAEAASKEFNYFVTSLFSAFTAFTTWQTLKNQYYIYDRRKKIRQIEKGEIVEVDELIGKGAKVNDVVLVKVMIGVFRDKSELRMENRLKSNRDYSKAKNLLCTFLIQKPCIPMTLSRRRIMC